MTIDKAIYDNRETAKKIRFLADIKRRYEKAKEGGYKGNIREFILKEKHKDILGEAGYKKGGPIRPNGLTTITLDDWLESVDPGGWSSEEDKPMKKTEATQQQQNEADRLWEIELKKMDLDKFYIPKIIDPEDVKISKRKVPNKLVAYKFGASSQQEEDLIGSHIDDWTNEISKGELDPSTSFMQYLDMILGRDKMNRGGIISAL